MNIINQLQRQYVDFLTSLFREGILDDQFLEIQKLQDESNPNFVNEIVTHFFEDSENLLLQLNIALEQRNVDYKKIDSSVHQFKGSSSSIGAPRVSSVCVAFKAYYNVRNLEGCLRCLQQVKDEYYLVKSKLQTLFGLEQQIVDAGGSVPVLK